MMPAEPHAAAALIVTAGAVAFALAVALWAYRLTVGARTAYAKWRARAGALEGKLERTDSILAAHPGVVLVWDAPPTAEEIEWGGPKIYGSPAALAAMLSFADAAAGPNPAANILNGVADFEARDGVGGETTLRRRLTDLRRDGEAFSLTILGPTGRFLDADGRPAGRRTVVWLADSTVKGLEESAARGRLEAARQDVSDEPLAFRDVLARASTPVWRMSSGLALRWANPAYLEAVEAESLEQAIANDMMLDAEVREQARRALSTGVRVDATRAVVAAGRRRHFTVSIFPVSGGAAGMAIDMTQAQESREALEHYVRAQDDVLNAVDDAVAIFSPRQELVFHNVAFRTLFNLEAAWLEQRPTHGELLDRLRERRLLPEQEDYRAWKAAELDRYTQVEDPEPNATWPLPDGRVLRLARLRQPMGGMIVVLTDLTDRVALETRFKTLVQVQRATLDKLNEAVVVFGSDGRLKLCSESFKALWGLSDQQVGEGAPFDAIADACVPKFHDRAVWRSVKGRITDTNPAVRQPTQGEMRRSDGRIVIYATWPLPDGATVIAFTDVTAARDLESALQERAEALEAADKIKSEFVTHVSYHLRAPMQSILGFAELLAVTTGPKLDPTDSGRLNSVLTAANHLSKMVDDILDIAAIDAETLELERGPADVLRICESAITLARATPGDFTTRLILDCPTDIGVIHADEKRLKQVIYNLVLNAVRACGEGGEITVGGAREGEGVRIWVKDDGPGIAPERIARVFDRFHSGDHSGAGLGLTLVRELVELHGGWVDLESEPDVGTRVTVHLPPVDRPLARPRSLDRPQSEPELGGPDEG